MTNIHPSAVIDASAKINRGVGIGPYCMVGPNVQLGDGVTLKAHVVVDGRSASRSWKRVLEPMPISGKSFSSCVKEADLGCANLSAQQPEAASISIVYEGYVSM
jgi:NDP-sugar pyrophosphorylase family protein